LLCSEQTGFIAGKLIWYEDTDVVWLLVTTTHSISGTRHRCVTCAVDTALLSECTNKPVVLVSVTSELCAWHRRFAAVTFRYVWCSSSGLLRVLTTAVQSLRSSCNAIL
jgi:hypothetical protein